MESKNESKNIMKELGSSGFKGLLNIWVLALLSKRQMNGYEIMKVISESTEGCFEPKTGSLYPVLHSLERKGLIKAEAKGDRHQIRYALTYTGKESVDKLRAHLQKIHKKHKFRRMFELLMWPEESEELRLELDKFFEAVMDLRNKKISDAAKIKKIRKAVSSLK